MIINVGTKAPNFELADQEGQVHTLSQYKGAWVLLYFYPRDNTSGCTKEACSFRDHFLSFKKGKIVVFGISCDSVESHKAFSKKYNLPFFLLSDSKKEVVKKYGVWQKKTMMGKEYMGIVRISFLINPSRKIAKIYSKVKPEDHAREVLEDYEIMKSFPPEADQPLAENY